MPSYRVLKPYTRQYPDPIRFAQGEAILRERKDDEFPGWWWCTDQRGKSGWVHEAYFEEEDYRILGKHDYHAWELTVSEGEVLEGIGDIGGWLMASKPDGEQGWVPIDHVQLAER
jgi:hypothetical protein